jgi:hypothetical protein
MCHTDVAYISHDLQQNQMKSLTSKQVNYLYVGTAVGLLQCSYLATFGDLCGCKSLSGEYAVVQSVEALRYKSEGRGFGSRWSHFHWLNPFARTLALGLTQPVAEMSKR